MRRLWVIVAVLIAFLVFETDRLWWSHVPFLSELPLGRATAALRIVAAFTIVWVITRRGISFLGLLGNPLIGLAFAAAASLPMWLPLALSAPLADPIPLVPLAFGAGYFPLSEEIFYRAFGFGLLFRVAGLPFWAAAGLTAVPFAAAHLSQADDLGGAVGTVSITFLGAYLFSWLFRAWNWNLWIPLGLHAAMNMWWSLFAVGDGAFAGLAPTAMQLGCAALAIALTLGWRRWGSRMGGGASALGAL